MRGRRFRRGGGELVRIVVEGRKVLRGLQGEGNYRRLVDRSTSRPYRVVSSFLDRNDLPLVRPTALARATLPLVLPTSVLRPHLPPTHSPTLILTHIITHHLTPLSSPESVPTLYLIRQLSPQQPSSAVQTTSTIQISTSILSSTQS